MPSALDRFGPLTRAWFEAAFAAPTPAQTGAWDAIARGDNALVVAPTGSGKTLAAFLWAIDRLVAAPAGPRGTKVLYVSPLKALAVDIERNLRAPLAGIQGAAAREGIAIPEISVAVRTGDTPQEERRRFRADPADILITTPESLFLLLTSAARAALATVTTVIVDEVHSVAGTKRGTHLALSLERLDHLLDEPAQRIGLSATVRPPDEVARWLGGTRPVEVVAPPSDKRFELEVVVPVEDLGALGEPLGSHSGPAAGAEQRASIWPHVEERLLEVIRSHRSAIVFTNSRRLSERVCARLNELAGAEVARAHHGSVSREQRLLIEEDLKAGRLPAVVATSSLELGIDMAAVDVVVQVESPDSVSSGLQRVGRAGHGVGEVSRGVFFPKYRGDLLECAVVVERMQTGAIESTAYPRNPLDVLAQQIVAMVAMDEWSVDDLEALVRRAAPYAELPRSALEAVLDMLSGRYPSNEFAELRARINWDRAAGRLTPRGNAQHLAVTSGGTIPDRGLFGVFLVGEKGARVGELDEEMVYESRPGDVFLLGASAWAIEEITHDRVLVSPAPGQPAKMPFWHGDAPGRPAELGRAIGEFVRDVGGTTDAIAARRLAAAGLDELAARNLRAYLVEQRDATGALPDDRTIVVERFRDELGDWRLCIHSFFGAKLHAPWAQALEARLRRDLGLEVQAVYSDDGIVVRLPDADRLPDVRSLFFDPDEVEDAVVAEVGSSALFASRFRECAARALLLPRRRPGERTPLWLQRQRSSYLLQVARKYESFPIVLEAYREALQDVFDLPGLVELMKGVAGRAVRVVEVETSSPSPFAASLQFGYISAFMYEGDTPLAERRAQALALDRALLAEILGRGDLRELIDEQALAELESSLQRLDDERKARSGDGLHDVLRALGDLADDEVVLRARDPGAVGAWLEDLAGSGRALRIRVAGRERWIAAEDAGRYRDALGVALPVGVPAAFLEVAPDAMTDLVGRYAATHGPFAPGDVATRWGIGIAVVETALRDLEQGGRVVRGEFRPGGRGVEWVDAEVLRRLRRKSLAALRKEIEPVPISTFARFATAWHGIGRHGPRVATLDSLYRVVEQLQGAPLPAAALETQILPARLPDYSPALLDELGAAGEIVWAGTGAAGRSDGWVVLALAEDAPFVLPDPVDGELSDPALRVREAMSHGGALFFRQIGAAVGSGDDALVLAALWELVWAGIVTNDTFGALRAYTGTRGGPSRRVAPRRRRGPVLPGRSGPAAGAGRWSLTPDRSAESTRRAHAISDELLLRHGIVTKGAVASERLPGGFASVYPVFAALEEAGSCRRGYFIEGLGGAQFALPGAVDRMRALPAAEAEPDTVVLAAADPANPYGAAAEWPERAEGDRHRPGRKAGSSVVLVDGDAILYVERGGRTLLSFTSDEAILQRASDALALAARDGLLGRLDVETADGDPVESTPLGRALLSSGFKPSSRGLRLRA